MTLDEAIKRYEKVAEEQRSNAHVYEDMMVFKQTIKHNTEAEYHQELFNECIECYEEHRQLAEWLKELKRLKEQEPCGDCISRQAVKEQMIKYGFHAPDTTVTEFVEDLPSVTPQPKTGKLTRVNDKT